MIDRLLTPEETAGVLRVTPRTVREWIRKGKLTGVKAGLFWRVRESDLQEFIKNLPSNNV